MIYSSGNHRRGTGRSVQRSPQCSEMQRRTATIHGCQQGAAYDCEMCPYPLRCPVRNPLVREVALSDTESLFIHPNEPERNAVLIRMYPSHAAEIAAAASHLSGRTS